MCVFCLGRYSIFLGCWVVVLLGSWILELLGCFVSGLLGGLVVCWGRIFLFASVCCWIVGLLGWWVVGLLSWIVGLLVCWFVVLLVCWSIGVLLPWSVGSIFVSIGVAFGAHSGPLERLLWINFGYFERLFF